MKKITLFLSAGLAMLCWQLRAQTTNVNGLVALVKYKDYQTTATKTQVENLLNQASGLSLWQNTTSVKEFYKVQTNNHLNLTATVVVVQLTQNSSYYHGQNLGYDGGQRLVQDVVSAINAQNPTGFTNLTLHPTENRLWYFSILSKSGPNEGAAVAYGLSNTLYVTNNGSQMPINNVALISSKTDQFDVSTICHEYGHALMSWTDYYRTAFCNLGDYDLMASAGTVKAPMLINPALRLQRGWIDNVVTITGTTTQTYTLTANDYTTIHKYVNPNNSKEYLLFHAMKIAGYYQSPLDDGKVLPEGLAIWYVNEDAGFDTPGQDSQFYIHLLQADNLDEMHDEDVTNGDIRSDLQDLYGNANKSFPNGHPARWRDGGEFGISISNISAPGSTMSFTVNARPSTVVASSDIYGTLSPKGTLGVASGSNATFTLTPNLGYDINTIKVNGSAVTVSNPYTLTGINGTKTLQATFKRQTAVAPLPSPWQKADIGSASAAGFAAQASGSFYLESYGAANSWSSDNCTYVYQTLSGDGSFIAHIKDYNRPTAEQKVGIMLRTGLQTNAAQLMIAKIPNAGLESQQRSVAGDNLNVSTYHADHIERFNLYNWMKITRTGNLIMSYCSRDGVTWKAIGQHTMTLPTQVTVGIYVTGANGSTPSLASFDNAQIVPSSPTCTFNGTKLTGTVIGTTGSWDNAHFRENVYDGNPFTYFDASDNVAWAGLTLSSAMKVTTIKYFPREGATLRMVGGKFQGSNVADFSTGTVDLATITTEPTLDWNCITVSNTSSFKYLRYISPTDGFGNVGEVEFYGSAGPVAPTVSITSPANNATFTPPASITINATASDADGTISKVEFYNGSTLLNTDVSAPYSYTWSSVAAGTYTITAKATDNSLLTTTSSAVTVTVSSATTADFCFEAESGSGQSTFAPFQVVSDASASGGKYIVVPNGTGNQSLQPTNSIATFSFNVPATATYYFWVRVIATTSNDNSMFIRTDANSFETWTPGTYTSWTWKKWTPSTSSSLSAGNHSISIARNEDGLQIDKIIVSKSSSTPSGLGCGASARMESDEMDATNADGNALIVSPNPSSDAFSILASEKAISYLLVTDAIGTQVFSTSNIAKGTPTYFGSTFENGLYTVQIKYEDGQSKSVKVIKIR